MSGEEWRPQRAYRPNQRKPTPGRTSYRIQGLPAVLVLIAVLVPWAVGLVVMVYAVIELLR